MAELTWKSSPIEPPEAIEALINELKHGSVDERHLEWEIDFTMGEATALFRAEVALHNRLRDSSIPADLRAKREPFLNLSIKIVNAERNASLDLLYDLIGKLRERNQRTPDSVPNEPVAGT